MTPTKKSYSPAAEALAAMTEPTPAADNVALPEGMSTEELLARIAGLEKKLAAQPIAAPQGQDTKMKNGTAPLVQKTVSGNVVTTVDPSRQFVEDTKNGA